VKTVWLMVRRKNEAAIRLYRKLGFVRTATVPKLLRGSIDRMANAAGVGSAMKKLLQKNNAGPPRFLRKPRAPRGFICGVPFAQSVTCSRLVSAPR